MNAEAAIGSTDDRDCASPRVVSSSRAEGLLVFGTFLLPTRNTPAGPIDVAACLTAQGGAKGDFETDTLLAQAVTGSLSHTLNTSTGCSEDGCGRGVPIITSNMPQIMAFAENSRGEVRLESGHGQITGALPTGGGKSGQGRPAVLSVALRGRDQGLSAEPGHVISPALRASCGGGDKGRVLVPDYDAYFHYEQNDLSAMDWLQWRVRRLMPNECERLQGVPDDWTLVPYRGKPADDAPRYKAIGNSMAVPFVAWLGHRLAHCVQKAQSSPALA